MKKCCKDEDVRQRRLNQAQARLMYAKAQARHAEDAIKKAEAEVLDAQDALDGRVVSVMFPSAARATTRNNTYAYKMPTYAYKVPDDFPDLRIGDFVITPPTGYGSPLSTEQVAVVAALGRYGWTGPMKELAGYVVKREGYISE